MMPVVIAGQLLWSCRDAGHAVQSMDISWDRSTQAHASAVLVELFNNYVDTWDGPECIPSESDLSLLNFM